MAVSVDRESRDPIGNAAISFIFLRLALALAIAIALLLSVIVLINAITYGLLLLLLRCSGRRGGASIFAHIVNVAVSKQFRRRIAVVDRGGGIGLPYRSMQRARVALPANE